MGSLKPNAGAFVLASPKWQIDQGSRLTCPALYCGHLQAFMRKYQLWSENYYVKTSQESAVINVIVSFKSKGGTWYLPANIMVTLDLFQFNSASYPIFCCLFMTSPGHPAKISSVPSVGLSHCAPCQFSGLCSGFLMHLCLLLSVSFHLVFWSQRQHFFRLCKPFAASPF